MLAFSTGATPTVEMPRAAVGPSVFSFARPDDAARPRNLPHPLLDEQSRSLWGGSVRSAQATTAKRYSKIDRIIAIAAGAVSLVRGRGDRLRRDAKARSVRRHQRPERRPDRRADRGGVRRADRVLADEVRPGTCGGVVRSRHRQPALMSARGHPAQCCIWQRRPPAGGRYASARSVSAGSTRVARRAGW